MDDLKKLAGDVLSSSLKKNDNQLRRYCQLVERFGTDKVEPVNERHPVVRIASSSEESR